MKLKVVKNSDAPDTYAQGEYRADLSGAYTEIKSPTFAAHLVRLGYAEYLAKDVKAAESKIETADLPEFVEREQADAVIVPQPSTAFVAAVPTEELTQANTAETISAPPAPTEPTAKTRGRK